MSEHYHRYRSAPSTDDYRQGWERIFGDDRWTEIAQKRRDAFWDRGRATDGLPIVAPGRGVFGRDGT